MRWQTAGRSAPHRKCPISPFAVSGDGISRPLFLHLNQQQQPMQCRPAFPHLHALSDRNKGEQVEYLVQIKHRAACSWASQMDKKLP